MLGKVIHNMLSQSTAVANIVNSNIYPLIRPQSSSTTDAAIVYRAAGLYNAQTKGTSVTLTGEFETILFSATYDTLQQLTVAVMNTFDKPSNIPEIDNQTVSSTSFASYTEDYDEGAEVYTSTLTFNIRKPFNNE